MRVTVCKALIYQDKDFCGKMLLRLFGVDRDSVDCFWRAAAVKQQLCAGSPKDAVG